MDIEEIKTLTDLMVAHDLSEIMLRDGDKRIVLRRGSRTVANPAPPTVLVASPDAATASGSSPVASPAPRAEAAAPSPDDAKLHRITSPMVGTFYAAPDPDSPPFVQVGDTVGPDTVVCIIEAMKVFNEIKAEVTGVVESIEVQNAEPLEFGQTIMTVRTD